ncbi:hypothetical protein CFN78_13110 [Amycolatopsis antarctica]|uniref:Zinc-finger domain-containing protein n=1 Tax=Amycolatopsis antarctica TaxID=1854586 RepID=A0A263D2K6_9PSEU|nr:zinc finger protein [Amycolatopsis antarctica]OZM72581.1 hypothetical protein CFN78_13110 [Amycolatopsis antarctica]
MLRWQQAEGLRHALLGRPPTEGGSFVSLCGKELTVARGDIPELGGRWFDPTCTGCEREWLTRV